MISSFFLLLLKYFILGIFLIFFGIFCIFFYDILIFYMIDFYTHEYDIPTLLLGNFLDINIQILLECSEIKMVRNSLLASFVSGAMAVTERLVSLVLLMKLEKSFQMDRV